MITRSTGRPHEPARDLRKTEGLPTGNSFGQMQPGTNTVDAPHTEPLHRRGVRD